MGGIPHLRFREQKGGRQAMVTSAVREFASRFKIDRSDPHSVVPLVRAVQKLKPHAVPIDQIGELYAKRTAEDVIHSGKVVILSKEDRWKSKGVIGCVDNALALIAALRAHRIKADFARLGNSSIVIFKMGGKDWSVNPARYSRRSVPNEVTATDLAGHRTLGRLGMFARGKDAWDIGMRSLTDFDRYSKARR